MKHKPKKTKKHSGLKNIPAKKKPIPKKTGKTGLSDKFIWKEGDIIIK